MTIDPYILAAKIIKESKHLIAFTGAGISIESGIPPFRGESGLWNSYSPDILDLNAYLLSPHNAWLVIKSLFYDHFGHAKPNKAHYKLTELEQLGYLKGIITQNIDHLHQLSGSKLVKEFHGTSRRFVCTKCKTLYQSSKIEINDYPPVCLDENCKAYLKPDFVFFGEMINDKVHQECLQMIFSSDVLLVIGTSGEVLPASSLPVLGKQSGCKIIEINPNESSFTRNTTDIYIQEDASQGLTQLVNALNSILS